MEFRVTLRRFQRWSEDQAQEAGLTHVQHQLLVAIKGHPGERPPPWATWPATSCCARTARWSWSIAPRRRAGRAGPGQGRRPGGRVRLTADGDLVLQKLTRAHLDRLHELAAVLDEFVTRHENGDSPGDGR